MKEGSACIQVFASNAVVLSRISKLKEQYKKKMEAEALKRVQAEKVVSKLEEEEARLIELLKEQQVQQQAAYTKLQDTIVDGEGEGPSTD